MTLLFVLVHRRDVLAYAVSEEAVFRRGGELHARHPRGLRPVERRGLEEPPEVGMLSHAFGAHDVGIQRQRHAVGRRRRVEGHRDDVRHVPPLRPLPDRMICRHDRERMREMHGLRARHVG